MLLFSTPKERFGVMVMCATASPGLNLCWAGNASALTPFSREYVKKPIQDKKKKVCEQEISKAVCYLRASQFPWEPPTGDLRA